MLLGWPIILVCQRRSYFSACRTFSARTNSDKSGQLLPTTVYKEWRKYAFSPVGHNTIAFIFWTFSTPTIIVDNWINVIYSIITILTVKVGRLHILQFYFCLLWVLICHPMATRRIKSWRKHPQLMFIYMTTVLYVGGDEGAQRSTSWKTQCWLGGTEYNLLIVAQQARRCSISLPLLNWLIDWNKHETKGLFCIH